MFEVQFSHHGYWYTKLCARMLLYNWHMKVMVSTLNSKIIILLTNLFQCFIDTLSYWFMLSCWFYDCYSCFKIANNCYMIAINCFKITNTCSMTVTAALRLQITYMIAINCFKIANTCSMIAITVLWLQIKCSMIANKCSQIANNFQECKWMLYDCKWMLYDSRYIFSSIADLISEYIIIKRYTSSKSWIFIVKLFCVCFSFQIFFFGRHF